MTASMRTATAVTVPTPGGAPATPAPVRSAVMDAPRGLDPHRSVLGDLDPLPPERLAEKRRLADAARRLVEAVAHLDLARTDEATIASLARRVAGLADELATVPSLAEKGGPMFAGDVQALIGHRSGIAGALNPLAPPMALWRDGDVTRGEVVFGSAYEGPPGLVHGGFLAAAFDELLTSAQLASGFGGMTGTLTVRMRRPVPLATPVDLEARVDRIDGRKIFASGVARVAGEVAVEGEIVCIAPRHPIR
jgi:acyl-coenzyme A thioesterase PaaI-like protein